MQGMKVAIEEALNGVELNHGGPFGACIMRNNEIIASAHNTVILEKDPTCHAEINAIRIASKKLKSFDLSNASIYSTTEPCPMCFSAIHWARIGVIIYGSTINDAKRIGFSELSISNKEMKSLGASKIKLFPCFLRNECKTLLREWDNLKNKVLY